MDASLDMIQVFEAVRNRKGEIIDFRWLLNNHAAEKYYGNVIGKRLLKQNPVLYRKVFLTPSNRLLKPVFRRKTKDIMCMNNSTAGIFNLW